jgi:hypothetical protein
MSEWFDYTAVMKILVFGLLVGGVLPVVFAVGVRLNAKGTGVIDHGGAEAHRSPALVMLSWLIFSLVLVAVIIGVLFIARDFIGQHTGLYILGARQK